MAWAAFRDTLLRMEGASGQVLIEVRSVKHRKQLLGVCLAQKSYSSKFMRD